MFKTCGEKVSLIRNKNINNNCEIISCPSCGKHTCITCIRVYNHFKLSRTFDDRMIWTLCPVF